MLDLSVQQDLGSFDSAVLYPAEKTAGGGQISCSRRLSDGSVLPSTPDFELNSDRSKPDVLDNFSLEDFEGLEDRGHVSDFEICGRENQDNYLIYWYHELVNPPESYLNFLDYLSEFTKQSYPALGQFTGFKAWEHYNGSRLVLPVIDTEKYNPADKFQSIRSSASRTAKSLTNLDWHDSSSENKKALVDLDLTFPSEISRKLESGLKDLDSRFWSVYKNFLDLLNGSLGSYSVGNSANLHLWSSEKPLDPLPHFHSSLIWAKQIGDELKPLSWYGKGKPVNPAEIKSFWAESINKEFGTSYCSDKKAYEINSTWLNSMLGHDPVVVNSSWIPLSPASWSAQQKENPESFIKKKVIHRLKYSRRKPLTDLGEYYTENEFSKEEVNFAFALDLINYQNSSRQFGYWTHLKQCVNVQGDGSEEKQFCPICGAEVTDVYRLDCREYHPDMKVRIGKRGHVTSSDPPDDSSDRPINLNTQRADFEEVEEIGGD